MSLRKKSLQGVSWSAIQNIGTQLISFAVFLVLARLLGPESFGLIALAIFATGLMGLLANYGFGAAIVQRAELEAGHLDTAFWAELGAKLLILLVACALAGPIAALFDQPMLESMIRVLSIGFLIDALTSIQAAVLRREMAFDVLAARSLVSSVAGGVVGIAMAFAGFGVWSLVGRKLASSLASLVLLWWASDWRPGLRVSLKHFKQLFSFGWGMMGSNIVGYFSERSDTLLIGYFLGPVMLGYYTIGNRLIKMLSELLVGTVNNVAWPMFSRLQREPERAREVFYMATQFVAMVAFPAFFGLYVLAPEIVPVIYGDKWAESIPVMQVLAFFGLANAVVWINSSVVVGMGKSNWYFLLESFTAVSTVVAILLAVNHGLVAVATAVTVVGLLIAPVSLWMVKRLLHIEVAIYSRKLLSILVSCVAMVVGIQVLKDKAGIAEVGILYLLIAVLAGAVIYFLCLCVLSPQMVRGSMENIKEMLPGRSSGVSSQ